MLSFFAERPLFYCPPWHFALGLAAGFYPLLLDWRLRLVATLLLVASGLSLLLLLGPRPRAILAAAFAFGSLAGFALHLREAALPPLGLQAFAVEAGADVGPKALACVGLAGRLASDSTPARGGLRSYELEADRALLAGPGIRGWCEVRGRARLLLRDGSPLAAGAAIEAGGEWGSLGGGPGEAPPFFGAGRDLLVRDRGAPPAILRNAVHEGFIRAAVFAAGGGREGGGPAEERKREDRAGLLVALLTGKQDALSPEDKAAFKAAGCSHILALSGQHLSLIAAGLAFLLRPLLGPRRALLPALLITTLYVLVVGPGPSLLRALIAFALAALVTLADRPQEGRGLLGLCFVVHAALFPGDLREAGFVLSYLAVGGLVVLAPRFTHALGPLVPPALLQPLAASIAAQCATAPWIALVFGIFQPVGIVATVLTGPLVEAVLVLGLVASALAAFFPAPAALLAPLEGLLLGLLSESMAFFAALPSLSLKSVAAAACLSLVVVLFSAFIYALPHVEHRAFRRLYGAPRGGRDPGPARLRLAPGPRAAPRPRGPRDDEALRAELPREPGRPPEDPRGARRDGG